MAETASSKPPHPSSAADPPASSTSQDHHGDSSGLSDLDSDDDSGVLAALQASRAAELQQAAKAAPPPPPPPSSSKPLTTAQASSPYSTLQTYTSEKAAMSAVASQARAVLLFTHAAMPVCGEMAGHLGRIAGLAAGGGGTTSSSSTTAGERMAGEHEHVLFAALDAEAAPFLTARLRVRVLPFVVGYVAGEEAGRLTGFEGLGRKGRTPAGWRRVAAVLRAWGVLGGALLVGEDEEDDEGDSDEGDGDGDDDGDGAASDDAARRRNAGSWIGRSARVNSKISTRGTARRHTADADDDDDDDDWD